jgi:hypothetical protein
MAGGGAAVGVRAVLATGSAGGDIGISGNSAIGGCTGRDRRHSRQATASSTSAARTHSSVVQVMVMVMSGSLPELPRA